MLWTSVELGGLVQGEHVSRYERGIRGEHFDRSAPQERWREKGCSQAEESLTRAKRHCRHLVAGWAN